MLGRFLRTFEHVFAMVWGDLDAAVASARRVHAIHTHIHGVVRETAGGVAAGTRYEANLPGALLWVHATLWDTSLQISELLLGPLSLAEKDAYWEETKRFAALFGIPAEMVPADWTAFRRYWDGMLASDVITVSRRRATWRSSSCAHRRGGSAPRGSGPSVDGAPVPPRLREEFGLAFGTFERAIAETSIAALRRAGGSFGALRYSCQPTARIAGSRPSGRDPVGMLLDQLVWLTRASR
jgi:uncharacterized protein (DUF2236 family)